MGLPSPGRAEQLVGGHGQQPSSNLNAISFDVTGIAISRAGLNSWLVVMGGRTAELGWFRTRTDTFHNDVALVDCEAGSAPQWRVPPVAGEAPQPREFHTLAALPGGRLLLFGGDLPFCPPFHPSKIESGLMQSRRQGICVYLFEHISKNKSAPPVNNYAHI